MSKKIKTAIIVESPTKAKTISGFIPKDYRIEASFGHIRDLPKGTLGVDVENNFEPKYVTPKKKIKQVNQFKKSLSEYELFYLATDPDREGEAIAYHVREILKKNNPSLTDQNFKRIVFHEITNKAIQESFEKPTMLDMKMFDSQVARRVLDRLVGYRLSPLLWKKIRRGLSAGRVQSVTVKLIVQREREIEAFDPKEYWEIDADFLNPAKDLFKGKLFKRGDITKKNGKITLNNEKETKDVLKELEKASYLVSRLEEKEHHKNPYPPFITSTLQRAAVNLLGFTSRRTMRAAQTLFEKGYITYMRTDSVHLSESAVSEIRKYIKSTYGTEHLPKVQNKYKSRSKVAQEAHEAIRPTDIHRNPETLGDLEKDELRIYDLIWKRTLACQMKPAVYMKTSCDVITKDLEPNYLFRVNGSRMLFTGWKEVYEDDDETANDSDVILPLLHEGDDVDLKELFPQQKFTQPPARYTEASLIKALEEHDIGRPSTYAPTISTILHRDYIEKEGRSLKPTEVGTVVNDFLQKYFETIMDYDFTAEMEEDLDAIARGEKQWQPIIKAFYEPFEKIVEKVEEDAKEIELEEDKTDEVCEKCGKPMVVKVGRFGRFLACTGYPDCKTTKAIVQKIDMPCPDCGGDIVIKRTKKRRSFYGCSNYPNCKFASWKKPGLDKENENGSDEKPKTKKPKAKSKAKSKKATKKKK